MSVYNLFPKLKRGKRRVNNSANSNLLNRQFSKWNLRKAIVSDLTYVWVQGRWFYLCAITDLCNREIIGVSVGKNKTAQLVKQAFMSINCDLRELQIFHTDRGSEFDNKLVSAVLKSFDIEHSLSQKGCPYDNAVAESTFKTIKKRVRKCN